MHNIWMNWEVRNIRDSTNSFLFCRISTKEQNVCQQAQCYAQMLELSFCPQCRHKNCQFSCSRLVPRFISTQHIRCRGSLCGTISGCCTQFPRQILYCLFGSKYGPSWADYDRYLDSTLWWQPYYGAVFCSSFHKH